MEEETSNFSSLVKKRIVVREFKEPRTGKFDSDIKNIANNGVKIPTAGFSRGIELLTILNSNNIKKISVIANEKKYTDKGLDPWISWSEGIIIILINKYSYLERYNKKNKSSSLNPENWERFRAHTWKRLTLHDMDQDCIMYNSKLRLVAISKKLFWSKLMTLTEPSLLAALFALCRH